MNERDERSKEYAELWKAESEYFDSCGVYQRLSQFTPIGNILEFGCGIGKGTRYLSEGRKVLSLEKNPYLIDEAQAYLGQDVGNSSIYKCDFFNLTDIDKKVINDFKPKIIAGWFIGSSIHDVIKHTPDVENINEKAKVFREKIEDIIISNDICGESVDYIHLVHRGQIVDGFSDEELFDQTKTDYDTYVFNSIGFEVVEVNNIEWPRMESKFQYSSAHNPILASGNMKFMITSILAKRK